MILEQLDQDWGLDFDFDSESMEFTVDLKHYEDLDQKPPSPGLRQFTRGVFHRLWNHQLKPMTLDLTKLETLGVRRSGSFKRLIRSSSFSKMSARMSVESPDVSAEMSPDTSFDMPFSMSSSSPTKPYEASFTSSVSSLSIKIPENEQENKGDNSQTIRPILKNKNANFEAEYQSVKQQDLVKFEDFLKEFETNELNRMKENLVDMKMLQLSNYYQETY